MCCVCVCMCVRVCMCVGVRIYVCVSVCVCLCKAYLSWSSISIVSVYYFSNVVDRLYGGFPTLPET